jgi:hypothetical protein
MPIRLILMMLIAGSTIADASPSGPDHFYVGRSGDAFEYARPSADGVDMQNRVLVWYVGTNGDKEPVIRYQDGKSTGTLTCFDSCQFVRGTTSIDGRVVHTGRIRLTNDPLIYGIMHDALAGRLMPVEKGHARIAK